MSEGSGEDGAAALAAVLAGMAGSPGWFDRPPRDVFASDPLGWTPLHVAATRGDAAAIAVLVAAGAPLEARAEHGYTPLHEAAEGGHLDAVRALLAAGADRDALNGDGLTPAALARKFGEHEIAAAIAAAAPKAAGGAA